MKALDIINDHIAFNALLVKLRSDIFFLPDKINIDEFKKKLGVKAFKEKTLITTEVETGLIINWDALIPNYWFDLNPSLSQYFENPVKLTSTFSQDKIITRQQLQFNNYYAAEIIFSLFRYNSNWKYNDEHVSNFGTPRVDSIDGNYTVILMKPSNEDDLMVSIPTTSIGLLYKKK